MATAHDERPLAYSRQEDVVMFNNCEQALAYMDAWWEHYRMVVEQSEQV